MDTPKSVKHEPEAVEFKAENQPLGEPIYDRKVEELAEEIRDGEIDADDAKSEAIGTLINEVFGTFGSNDEGR